MSKQTNATGWYGTYFKAWQVKLLGPKPTEAQLATIHGLGARPGKQALANAMALRDCGVTGSQIVSACGALQLNKMRGFITDGLLKREAVPAAGTHTVYKLTLTAKGATRVKAGDVAKAKAIETVKAKGKAAHKANPGNRAARKAAQAAAKAAVADAPAPVVTDAAPAEAQPQA